jgi:hypothetical protein
VDSEWTYLIKVVSSVESFGVIMKKLPGYPVQGDHGAMSQQISRILTSGESLPHALQPDRKIVNAATRVFSKKFGANSQLDW